MIPTLLIGDFILVNKYEYVRSTVLVHPTVTSNYFATATVR